MYMCQEERASPQVRTGTVEVPEIAFIISLAVTSGTIIYIELPSTVQVNSLYGIQDISFHVTALDEGIN